MYIIYIVRRSAQKQIVADTEPMEGDEIVRTMPVPDQSVAEKIRRNPGELVPDRVIALIDRFMPSLPRQGLAGPYRSIGG